MAGAPPMSRRATAAATLVILALTAVVAGDQFEQDKKECAPQLVGLSPCLSYVGGQAKMPTMDCCTALKQVLATSKKCLCLLIKYRNEPDLGIKIDANLALGLPSVCHAPSNISDCPALLHLAANSPDAKVFTDFAKGSSNSTSTSSNSTATPAASTTTVSSKDSGGGPPSRRVGALPVFYGFLVIFLFLLFCPI